MSKMISKEYEYAFIPIIALEIITVIWCSIALIYFIFRFKNKKTQLKISITDLKEKYLSILDSKITIVYENMLFNKYKYNYKNSKLIINKKLENSLLFLNILVVIKMFNDIRLENIIYNGERIILNTRKILEIIRYIFIFPFLFNIISIILFIFAINNATLDVVLYANLIKVLAVLGLSLFLFLWFIWVYNYDKYIKQIQLDITNWFDAKDIKYINYFLKFNYILLGIK